MESSKFI